MACAAPSVIFPTETTFPCKTPTSAKRAGAPVPSTIDAPRNKRSNTRPRYQIRFLPTPARLLGLTDKGHLGVGADADITIYDDREDREAMFAAPRYVIKDGRAIVELSHGDCGLPSRRSMYLVAQDGTRTAIG